MSNIKVSGSASGTGEITIAAPVTNSSRTQTLPDATGTVLLDSAATVSGNLAFTGTGNRITGDFTNTPRTNRVMFQTSIANSPTRVGVLPSGTGTVTELGLYNTSDPDNASFGQLLVNATEFSIRGAITGTGSYVPITFNAGGSEQMRLTTAGNLGIGTTTPAVKLDVQNSRAYFAANNEAYATYLRYNNSTPGVFLGSPSANAFQISGSGGGAYLNIDSSGNVGIGTSSPGVKLDVNGALRVGLASNPTTIANNSQFYDQSGIGPTISGYNFTVRTGSSTPSETFRITTAGDVGIGTSSPGQKLTVGANGVFRLQTGSVTMDCTPTPGATDGFVWNISAGYYDWSIGGTSRARITSGGYLLVGTTSAVGDARLVVNNPDNVSGDFGFVTTLGSNCNNTSSYHYIAATGAADKFYVYGNGNVVNTNGSYGTLSDVKLKENIVDATPKLADVMRLQVRNFNLKTEPGHKQIGFVAQEFEQVFPAMVDESPDRDKEGNQLETTTKHIKTSVLVPILVKAIQELKAEFDAYKATHP